MAIHKSGDSESPNNFRPVLLTSLPCEIMKQVVLQVHHLNEKLDSVSVLHH